MINTGWELSHLYASNDEFMADFEKTKYAIKNLEKYKNKLKKNNKKIILTILTRTRRCPLS